MAQAAPIKQKADQSVAERANQRRKLLKADVRLTKGGPTATAIAQLLADQGLSYDEIARRVREGMPGAPTLSHSVASVAESAAQGRLQGPRPALRARLTASDWPTVPSDGSQDVLLGAIRP